MQTGINCKTGRWQMALAFCQSDEVRSGSFASILACPHEVWSLGYSGIGSCPVEGLAFIKLVSIRFWLRANEVRALVGFFRTKSAGYGKYTTSILVIVMVLFAGLLAIFAGKGEWPAFANLLFAITGFAGGLVAPKSGKDDSD